MLPFLAALASERVETASVDGEPVVLRVDDTTAAFTVQKGPASRVQRDWSGATVLSAGMRRWWTIQRVQHEATRALLERDTAGWIERALERCPQDSPAHLWLATAASLGGTNLDAMDDSEEASQQAARFRQQARAKPRGIYALDALRPLAALDAWLAEPMPSEVKRALESLLTGPMRNELGRMQRTTLQYFGEGRRGALVPRGNGDPLIPLLTRDLDAPPVPPVDQQGSPAVRPQEGAEPCSRCSHLVAADADWRGDGVFREAPLLLVPVGYDERNRPILQGFVGVEVREARILYARPPQVRDAGGEAVAVGLQAQEVDLYEPRPVRVVLDRAPTQAELVARFAETLDVDAALADLRPPENPSRCGCASAALPSWRSLVRRRARRE